MPRKKPLAPIAIPLPLLLAAPSSPLPALQAAHGGVPLPVRAEDYVAALRVADAVIKEGTHRAAARGFVNKLHESTKSTSSLQMGEHWVEETGEG